MTTNTATDARRFNFFIIDNEAFDNYDLNPYEGWLYIAIVRHINQKTGVAFPSLSTLAAKTKMSKQSVVKYLETLETKGLIKVDRQYDDAAKTHKPNHYTIMGVVKEVDKGSTPVRQGVVKEVDTNNTKSKKDETKKKDQKIAPGGAKGEKPVQPHIALVDAYWAGIPGGKPVRDDYKRHVKVAVALSEAGFRPDEVTQFLVDVYDPATDKFDYRKWHDKPITFEAVADMIPIWKAANTPPPPPEEIDFGTKAEWEARRDAYHQSDEFKVARNAVLAEAGHAIPED
ncbi:MAG: helix-turn-helix domain-containing protein [Planctomycetota bacterium]|jgi:biotin operon repressor